MLLALLLAIAPQKPIEAKLTLPAEARVRGTELALGRLARVECADAAVRARLERYSLGWAPAPGYSRLVQRWQLERELAHAFPTVTISSSGAVDCRVAPEVARVTSDEIASKARGELEELFRGRDARIRATGNVAELEVPAPNEKLELRAVNVGLAQRELRGGAWNVGVQVWIDGTLYQTAWTTFAVELWADVPVLVRDVARGELLSPDMVETRRVELGADSTSAALSGDSLAGAVAQRDLARGSIVQDRDVRRAQLVATGEPVTLEVRKGAVVARSTVTCKQDGRLGDRVKIVNAGSARELTALVVGRALVRIEL